MSTFKLPVEQVGLERSIQRAMDQFNRKPLKINVDDRSFTQPLGRITGAADEFTKSIEASNARVVAFGASVAVIESVKNAFTQLVVQTIKVEKALADINVVMGTTSANLDKFGNSLFKIAKNTAQSFDSVAIAATEFARQGLSMEQTLKRTNDALILTRLTGMKAADSVKGLTAAINAFGDAGLSTANIMNKLAAVDMAFAVSSEDLIDGLSRASAVAQDAGMNIDQLIGAITAAQQITARGGAVIGNSFKTIFTRIQRPQTIEQLEMLGVAVKDMQGNVIPAIKILENLAKTYDTLSQSQQSNIAQLVGGMFQINTLKAAMRDLGKENSITARAIQISASATDEAIAKNEQLNKTLDALLTKTGLSLQKLSEQIGSITVGPGIEKILKAVDGLASGISNVLDGDSIGSTFANGFLKGLGNVISGPGAILILGLVGKLFVDVAKFAKTSISNFMGMTSEAQKQQAVQESILNLLRTNHEVVGSLIGQGQTKKQQEQVILDLIVKQTAAQREQLKLAQHLSKFAVNIGANQELVIPERGARKSASGYIPNFNAKQRERSGAVAGGYAPGSVKSMDMPSGQMVIYNTAEQVKEVPGFKDPFINPPLDSRAGRDHRQKSMEMYGFDPYANKGFIPNFAKLTMKQYMERPGATLQGLTDRIARNEISGAGAQNMSNDIYMAVQAGKKIKDANAAASLEAKRKASDAKRMKIDGTGYATLVPQLNRAPSTENGRKGTFKSGSSTYPYILSNLLVAGPKSPSTGATTDPEETNLETSVSTNLFKSSAQFSNAIRPAGTKGVNAPTIKKKLESTPGGKGAVGAAVGAAFEAAVAQAYGIDSAMSAERGMGDFDVNLSNTKKSPGVMKKVRSLFGIPATISRMDFKASTEKGTFDSMAKKIFNDNKSKYLAQIGAKASAGFIPNFAKDHPLIDAIQREKDAGLPVSKIRVNQSDRLKSSSNPMGLAVTNTRDEPRGMADVPNFAKYETPTLSGDLSFLENGKQNAKVIASKFEEASMFAVNLSDEVKEFVSVHKQHAVNAAGLNKKTVVSRLKELGYSEAQTREALKQLGFSKEETQESIKVINANRGKSGQESLARPGGRFGGLAGRIGERMSGMGSRFGQSGAGKRTKSFGRFMGGYAGFGLPMAGGLIDQGLTSAFGGDRTEMTQGERVASSAAGSVTTGASSGAMLGGALGSIIPGLGTAVGSAIGAAVGGGGGLISALGKATLTQEELAKITQESVSAQNELNNTFSQLDTLENRAGSLSEEQIQKELAQILKASNQNIKNDQGQTFAQAFGAAKTTDERRVVQKDFAKLSQQDVSVGQLSEQIGKFSQATSDAQSFFSFFGAENEGVGQDEKSALASALGSIGASSDQLNQISRLKKAPRRAPRGETEKEKTARQSKQISGTSVAKILLGEGAKELDPQKFKAISEKVDEIIKDGGWDEFVSAAQQSSTNMVEVLESTTDQAQVMKETAKNFAALRDNIQAAAFRSKVAFAFLDSDLKISKELDALKFKFSTLNDGVSKRISKESQMLQSQAAASVSVEREKNLQETKNKILAQSVDKLRKADITPANFAKFNQEIENLSADELKNLLSDPQALAERIGLPNKDSLDAGRELNTFLKDFITTFSEKDTLLALDLELQKKQIDSQMKIKELQEKEAKSRQSLSIAVDDKVREIQQLQLTEQLGFKSEIRAMERKQRFQPFKKVGAGNQELFDIQQQQAILAKRKEANEKDQIRNIQIQGAQLFKDTSVQDAITSSNDKLIIAIDNLRETLINGDPTVGSYNKDADNFIQGEDQASKMRLAMQSELEMKKSLLNRPKQAPIPGDIIGKGDLSPYAPKKFSSRKMTRGSHVDSEKAEAEFSSNLTEEIKNLESGIDKLNKTQTKISPTQGPISTPSPLEVTDTRQSVAKAQNYNLNQIFTDAFNQTSLDSKVDPNANLKSGDSEKFREALKDNIYQTLIADIEAFEGLADSNSAEIRSKIQDLNEEMDGAFDPLLKASNAVETQFNMMENSAANASHELEETRLDLEAQSAQIKASTDVFNKLQHATEETAYAIKQMQLSGDAPGAAAAQLSLQEQYASQSVEGKAAMRQGMAAQGLAPMSNRQTFMAGVTTNMQSMEATDTRFYKTLGQELPKTFANNMSKALIDAGSGIQSWDDALQGVALGFLDTLNQAIQQRLSDQILGAVTTGIQSFGGPGFKLFSKGGVVRRSDGGEVFGGSGTKDDVPAMLNSGEYVIRKSAVNKYGKDFLSSINEGTVKQRNQGGMAGPADPTRKLDAQSGEGGFLISSLGQAGTFEAGAITGRDNLMSFATQSGTSGARDVIQSTGAVDDYGQAIPGGGVNIQLEDESDRLSGLGLISGNVADEVMTAKKQALDAVGAYDKNVAAIKKYKEQRRKAIKNAIKQALVGAALSFGMSQLQSAVQSTQVAKASNTMSVQAEATSLAKQSGIKNPNVADIARFSNEAAGNLKFSSGDFYSKNGAFDIAKANSRFSMNGISNPSEFMANTQGARGSTSFTKNLFSRGGNFANRSMSGTGIQVNSLSQASQRSSGLFGFGGPSAITTDAAISGGVGSGSSTVAKLMSSQMMPNITAAGTQMAGFAPAASIASVAETASTSQSGRIDLSQNRATNFAVGGKVTQFGGSVEKKVPTLLTGGEFVIKKDAVKKHGLSFFNDINAQRLNKGGVVGKGSSLSTGGSVDSQSDLLQQILDTLIMQGENTESTLSETQTLREKIESKTTNNVTTAEAGETSTNQTTILQSILEEIKNQPTNLSQEISNSVQNIINKNESSSTEINNSSTSNSNSSVRNSSNVSSVSNSNFVDQATIQNDLLSQILLAVSSTPSSRGGGFSTSSGGSGGGGVGNININVTVDAGGKSESSYEGGGESDMQSSNGVNTTVNQKANNIAKQIEEAVIKIMTDQQRLGGVLPNPSKK